MNQSETPIWRDVIDKHLSAMIGDLEARAEAERAAAVDSAVAAAVDAERAAAEARIEQARIQTREETREATRRATAESLNQTLRRMRHVPSQAAAFNLLADATAPWCGQALVMVFEQDGDGRDCARVVSFRGPDSTNVANETVIEIGAAAAIISSVETKDPIVALATAAELSPTLAAAFGTSDGARAYLYPIAVRQNLVAMLIASGNVVPAPLELLASAAGMKLESLLPEAATPLKPLAGHELVQIAATPPSHESAPRRGWSDLTADEQRLHLRAQRVARVRVAEIRLENAAALRRGVFSGNVYKELRDPIDRARAEFLQTFLTQSPTMVDYLHLEILRSLANDDDRLLGSDYPGPMV